MINKVYILNETASSAYNGIGTYLGELVHCLLLAECRVCFIMFNASCEEFKIEEGASVTRMYFPLFDDDFKEYPNIFSRFFRLYITDSTENAFFFSYSGLDKIMEMLRLHFPLSKQFYVIHDFSWTSILLGNCIRLKRIISHRQ